MTPHFLTADYSLSCPFCRRDQLKPLPDIGRGVSFFKRTDATGQKSECGCMISVGRSPGFAPVMRGTAAKITAEFFMLFIRRMRM
jgi:hypothetical protein